MEAQLAFRWCEKFFGDPAWAGQAGQCERILGYFALMGRRPQHPRQQFQHELPWLHGYTATQ